MRGFSSFAGFLKTSPGVLTVLLIAAFLTRLMPLSMSLYPWNNDSLTDCGIAEEILSSGSLEYSSGSPWEGTHSLVTPGFNVLIAFIAGALGTTAITVAQYIGAAIAIPMIGGLFLLGRMMSGDLRGGVAAAFMGLLMGTFVFTTGSLWKITPGLCLLILVVFAYVQRDSPRYRYLTIAILLLLPLVHHLVTAVALILFAYLLVWSWHFSLTNRASLKRAISDAVTIVPASAVALLYYYTVDLDRMVQYSSPMRLGLIISGFAFMSLLLIAVLSLRSHVKFTFAPVVGAGLATVLLADFYGLLFPYEPSASSLYLLLILAFALFSVVAWYGSEIMLESSPRFRAVQIALLISPLTILGYGFINGISLDSQQVVYRSFDMLDIFLFLGVGVGLVEILRRHRKLYTILGTLLIFCLAVSFPFAYYSEPLLGVRHDTQAYEVDALLFLRDHHGDATVVTDERLGYIARATTWVHKDPSLPRYLDSGLQLPFYSWFYVIEDSWTTRGVNNFPDGLLVVDRTFYEEMLLASDVFYIGGPVDDRIVVFTSSPMGYETIYGS